MNWQWYFIGILCAGTSIMSTSSPSIRRRLFEDALLPSVSFDRPDDSHSWTIRFAAVVVLAEIYQLHREEAVGVLAHGMLVSRKAKETNFLVGEILKDPKCNIPAVVFSRRLSYLYKYLTVQTAEQYSDMQNCYAYLRKELKSSQDRKERTRSKNGDNLALPDIRATHVLQHAITERKNGNKFKNLNNIEMPAGDYHQIHKTVENDSWNQEKLYSTYNNELTSMITPPSFTLSNGANGLALPEPFLSHDAGSPNRRKLFDSNKAAATRHTTQNVTISPVRIPMVARIPHAKLP
jgi:hypothetical protein